MAGPAEGRRAPGTPAPTTGSRRPSRRAPLHSAAPDAVRTADPVEVPLREDRTGTLPVAVAVAESEHRPVGPGTSELPSTRRVLLVSRRRLLPATALLAATCLLTSTAPAGAAASAADPGDRTSDATSYNDAALDAADPFVLWDEASASYYAYSTAGAGQGADGQEYRFGIYRSPDLVTWEHLPGGALPTDDGHWGRDWFWAPAAYHNAETGKYFLFYSARQREDVEQDFGHADFEEPSKVGVAVADSPAGPFEDITDAPLDYFPYDPDYDDVNLIMDAEQKRPPATQEEGRTAPKGTYIPFIDPDVFFDEDGRVFLYFSRNAYRNWVWDDELGKYVEESNIYAVELTRDWWDDPTGTTAPSVAPRYVGANGDPEPDGTRRDGYVPVIDYGSDPQDWENGHVDDYAESGGARKDRRWAEGSTTFRRDADLDGDGDLDPLYYLLYSANNWEDEDYGVGYATASSPLGPWTKHAGNPVLSRDDSLPMTGTGHGSLAFSPDGQEAYYVHHGRPAEGPRKLYTERFHLDGQGVDAAGAPVLVIDQSVADEPVPSGVAPYALSTDERRLRLDLGGTTSLDWSVRTAPGGLLPLGNPLNRVTVDVDRPGVVDVAVEDGSAEVSAVARGTAVLTVRYQRQLADGTYVDVHQGGEPVEERVRVVVGGRPAR